MNHQGCANDVLPCHLCETPAPPDPMYCDMCNIHLCKACVGEHLTDQSKEHKVLPFEKRGSTPKCSKHLTKLCELYCEECGIPICTLCVSSGDHIGHKQFDFTLHVKRIKKVVQKDLQEFEESIYPKYQKIASILPTKNPELNDNSEKVNTDISQYGKDLHGEIDTIIKKLKSDLTEMYSKNLSVLKEHEDQITRSISDIGGIIADLKKLLNSNNINLLSAYKSRIDEFRKIPLEPDIFLPRLTYRDTNKDHFLLQLRSLLESSIRLEIDSTGAESAHTDIPLSNELKVIADIRTEYGYRKLRSVVCLSDEEIWTCGEDQVMRLYNLKGKLLKCIQTKSGNNPYDIAVTRSRDLVYSDNNDSTVNIVKKTQIHTVIRLKGWRPLNVCSTSCGDLLVIMDNDKDQAKVVRYSGSTEKQSIQHNDEKQPLFSSRGHKHIVENRNQDICVADVGAGAVVVVNQAGNLRFTFKGPNPTLEHHFIPYGITTDSQSHILTAAYNTLDYSIYIIDQNGQFLRKIVTVNLGGPWGLFVDTKDNLIVAENETSSVKKVQYYM